eukprot:TRINITY_DN54005_c0_g2_i1.p1 TRINITY_DN54005_c0_g2~~TRINITY_DN54005_c0_g2_i1.p1  ORF type:complete len:449 (-),score=38.64 TRINITY_DN54005_c0_g2_i1:8-1264(-)
MMIITACALAVGQIVWCLLWEIRTKAATEIRKRLLSWWLASLTSVMVGWLVGYIFQALELGCVAGDVMGSGLPGDRAVAEGPDADVNHTGAAGTNGTAARNLRNTNTGEGVNQHQQEQIPNFGAEYERQLIAAESASVMTGTTQVTVATVATTVATAISSQHESRQCEREEKRRELLEKLTQLDATGSSRSILEDSQETSTDITQTRVSTTKSQKSEKKATVTDNVHIMNPRTPLLCSKEGRNLAAEELEEKRLNTFMRWLTGVITDGVASGQADSVATTLAEGCFSLVERQELYVQRVMFERVIALVCIGVVAAAHFCAHPSPQNGESSMHQETNGDIWRYLVAMAATQLFSITVCFALEIKRFNLPVVRMWLLSRRMCVFVAVLSFFISGFYALEYMALNVGQWSYIGTFVVCEGD